MSRRSSMSSRSSRSSIALGRTCITYTHMYVHTYVVGTDEVPGML